MKAIAAVLLGGVWLVWSYPCAATTLLISFDETTIATDGSSASTKNMKVTDGMLLLCEGQNVPLCNATGDSISDLVVFFGPTVVGNLVSSNVIYFFSEFDPNDKGDLSEVPADPIDNRDAIVGGNIITHAIDYLTNKGYDPTYLATVFANKQNISESGVGPTDYIPTSGDPGFSTNRQPGDNVDYRINSDPTGIPEPSSILILGVGTCLALICGQKTRRRRWLNRSYGPMVGRTT